MQISAKLTILFKISVAPALFPSHKLALAKCENFAT